jgi:hypothetical protein
MKIRQILLFAVTLFSLAAISEATQSAEDNGNGMIDWDIQLPTTYTNGDPLDAADITEVRVYCNDQLMYSGIDTSGQFAPPGDISTCYVTTIAGGQEAGPSVPGTWFPPSLTIKIPTPPTILILQ